LKTILGSESELWMEIGQDRTKWRVLV